jgi:hypothetical protein
MERKAIAALIISYSRLLSALLPQEVVVRKRVSPRTALTFTQILTTVLERQRRHIRLLESTG